MLTPGLSTRSRLLVATPPLADPNFDRTVVYVLEHTATGAVGVVLNRCDEPTDGLQDTFDIEALASWQPHLAVPALVFIGGPVGDDSLIALAAGVGRNDQLWGSVTGSLGTVDLSYLPDEVAERLEHVRIYRGYSGWGPGQLEAELEAGAWMVFDAVDDDVFTSTPDDLWRTVVRRQGGRLAWIADAPDDISAN